ETETATVIRSPISLPIATSSVVVVLSIGWLGTTSTLRRLGSATAVEPLTIMAAASQRAIIMSNAPGPLEGLVLPACYASCDRAATVAPASGTYLSANDIGPLRSQY